MEALARLQQNAPRNANLAKRALRAELRINVSNVALEAGHSRTLIGHANCRYPKLRASILAAKQPMAETHTAIATIRALRQTIQELRDQIRRNDSINATLVIRARASERRTKALEQRLARQREVARASPAGNTVTPFR
jgi:hypothetical protein